MRKHRLDSRHHLLVLVPYLRLRFECAPPRSAGHRLHRVDVLPRNQDDAPFVPSRLPHLLPLHYGATAGALRPLTCLHGRTAAAQTTRHTTQCPSPSRWSYHSLPGTLRRPGCLPEVAGKVERPTPRKTTVSRSASPMGTTQQRRQHSGSGTVVGCGNATSGAWHSPRTKPPSSVP